LVRHPEALLRGLIHSDGCRFTNTGTNWRHPRYSFSNLSGDIRRLFCEGCDLLGIHSTVARARSTCRASTTSRVLTSSLARRSERSPSRAGGCSAVSDELVSLCGGAAGSGRRSPRRAR
jgi:hypothetical protein